MRSPLFCVLSVSCVLLRGWSKMKTGREARKDVGEVSEKLAGRRIREQRHRQIRGLQRRVFAIAITLLVIEVEVPHLENEPEGTTLFGALLDLRPLYLGYDRLPSHRYCLGQP